MKKSFYQKLILVGILLCVTTVIYAQVGIKLGGNLTNADTFKDTKYKFSGFVGATYDIPLSSTWYIQPGILFTNIGYKIKNDRKKENVGIYGFEVPVNLSYRPRINSNSNLIVDLGVWGFCGVFGKDKYEYFNSDDTSMNISGNDLFKAYNRFNIGLNIGVGMSFQSYYGIISYQRGLTYLTQSNTGHLNIFRLGIGYKF